MTAAAAVVFVAALTPAAGAQGTQSFTLQIVSAEDVDSLDPALATSHVSLPILGATCSTLYEAGADGRPPRPGAASDYPRSSRDGRSFTIAIRSGLRFSDGRPVTAASYALAITRLQSLGSRALWAPLVADIASVTARGGRLVVELRKPVGDLVSRLAMPWACPVPAGLPADPGGIGLRPGSGPTSSTRTRPAERWSCEGTLATGAAARADRTRSSSRSAEPPSRTRPTSSRAVSTTFSTSGCSRGALLERLAERHGVNRKRFFAVPSLGTVYLALNVERPLFRRNPALRRAVNLTLDRTEILRQGGFLRGRRTDRLLPPGIPGFEPARLYPLRGPDVRAARRLASGHLRGGRAVLYTGDEPASLRRAEIVRRDLGRIGLYVEIQAFARPVLVSKASQRGEPFDLVLTGWHAHYPDPAEFLVSLLDGTILPRDNVNLSYFQAASRKIEAAHRLPAPERYAALGRLEAELMRGQAPVAPLFNPYSYFLVSARVGCLAFRAFGPDYGSFCLT